MAQHCVNELMKIAIPKERWADEARVAASPDTVKKFVSLGCEVVIEESAGKSSSISDAAFTKAGAIINKGIESVIGDADIVLRVQRPMGEQDGDINEIEMMKTGAILIGNLSALSSLEQVKAYARKGLTVFALELLPRIGRAQSMDVLSSQSNLAGYKAVLDATNEFTRALPMMMTAAGTIPPAKVIVLGAGVAGLQAIATARRLGAIVTAYDVRPAVKEQVESLGAKFIEVDSNAIKDAENRDGYATEMSSDYQEKQREVLQKALKKNDIVICTALIPGRPAPLLIPEDVVEGMREGSVIVDLAVEQGGNCILSELGKTVEKHGVTVIGHANVPSRLAADATSLYAKNLLHFLSLIIDVEKGSISIDWKDEIIQGCTVVRGGEIVNAALGDTIKTAKAS